MAATQDTELIDAFLDIIDTYHREDIGELADRYPKDQTTFTIDYANIHAYDIDLADDVRKDPDQLRKYAEEAVSLYDLPIDVNLDGARVKFSNVEDPKSVASVRTDDVGKLRRYRGQISKLSPVKPKLVEACYECQRCGTTTTIPQSGDTLGEPHECSGCERQGPFNLNKTRSEYRDFQKVRLKQPPEETAGAEGANLDIHLQDDLVQAVGDGGVKPGAYAQLDTLVDIQMDDNSTIGETYARAEELELEETEFTDLTLEADDLDRIKEIANGDRGDPYEMLTDSILPKLHGREYIRLALVLQLFRGVQATYPDGSIDRGDSHILLLGDPGTGKSTVLSRMEEVAPRATYASGKGASAAGLTAAAVPSDFGDEKWSIEAGALVLASGGVACVDEIDKVKEDAVSSLHGALESQRVEVSKAGINATLTAETSLLAAGNPKYGRFDDYESIADQIDIGPTLLSRFDLMFCLIDDADEEEDRALAESMVENRNQAVTYSHHRGEYDDDSEIQGPIDDDIIRKYIAHARRDIHPRIVDEDVRDALVEKFISLRQAAYGDDQDNPIPVTPRKLEAMQRLVEASARVRLDDVVRMSDVTRVFDLLRASLKDVGMNEEGELDADVYEADSSKPQRDRMKAIKLTIDDLANEHDDGAPKEKVISEMSAEGFDSPNVQKDIAKLKSKGEVYEPKDDHLRTS